MELTKDADALYQLALVAMGSRQYQEARTLWLTAAQKAPGTWLELLGKGMAMYEDAPVHSEHGPAREYRLALAYLAVSFIQNPEPNPIALWYVADTSAKLGTGYRYQGAEAEQKLWRQLSLQAYSVIFSTWLYNDIHGYKTLSKVIEIGWAQERFLNLRQLHESLGYDDGDLIALPDSDFGATYDVRPIISELQAIQNYGEFSLMDQRPYQRQLLHLLVTINREEQQKSGDGWRERAMKRSIEKCRRSVYLDLPGFPALIRAGIRACDI